VGLKRQTSIHLLDEVLVQPLRMLVQSEPHSHTEYVHFEPSPVMVSLGRIKDFRVVRAVNINEQDKNKYDIEYHSNR
jgi:hypothetical protein